MQPTTSLQPTTPQCFCCSGVNFDDYIDDHMDVDDCSSDSDYIPDLEEEDSEDGPNLVPNVDFDELPPYIEPSKFNEMLLRVAPHSTRYESKTSDVVKFLEYAKQHNIAVADQNVAGRATRMSTLVSSMGSVGLHDTVEQRQPLRVERADTDLTKKRIESLSTVKQSFSYIYPDTPATVDDEHIGRVMRLGLSTQTN